MIDQKIKDLYLKSLSENITEGEADELIEEIEKALPGVFFAIRKRGETGESILTVIENFRKNQRVFVAGEHIEKSSPFQKP